MIPWQPGSNGECLQHTSLSRPDQPLHLLLQCHIRWRRTGRSCPCCGAGQASARARPAHEASQGMTTPLTQAKHLLQAQANASRKASHCQANKHLQLQVGALVRALLLLSQHKAAHSNPGTRAAVAPAPSTQLQSQQLTHCNLAAWRCNQRPSMRQLLLRCTPVFHLLYSSSSTRSTRKPLTKSDRKQYSAADTGQQEQHRQQSLQGHKKMGRLRRWHSQT